MTQLPLPTMSRADEYEADFIAFNEARPEVWQLFVKFAFEVMAAGHARYSSDAICHRIRWHTDIEKVDGEKFKLNDHYTRYYAEKWRAEYPEHASLFAMRQKPSLKR